jgi:DNA-binding MarR family transcriptional regulator
MKKSIIDLIFQLKSSCLAKEDKIREELRLSPAEFRGLLSMFPGSEIPCNILTKKMGLSVSRGSRIIDKLVKNGYLKENKNDKDGRITKITLTSKGITNQKKIHKILEDCENTILTRVSRSELSILENSLIKLSDILISD